MAKYLINGSTISNCCSLDMFLNTASESINITLGFNEVMTALSDILSDADMLSNKDFNKLLDVASEIQSMAILRDVEKVCENCDDSCVSCELRNFR